MKRISFNEIILNPNYDVLEGSFGEVRRCFYKGNPYIIKTFKDLSYLKGKKRKLSLLSEVDRPGLYVYKFWVEKNSCLSEISEGKEIFKVENKNKIEALKNTKNLILTMHDEGIIHGDLINSNILVNKTVPSIIDFDNCKYKGYDIKFSDANDFTQAFMKKYGINEELDIFLFNLLTFSIINDCKMELVRQEVLKNRYGYFNYKDGIKICNSLFLDDKAPNKDFLIDTIDEAKLTF